LGFFFKALSKGVQIEFSKLEEGASKPLPLAAPHETRFPGPGVVPYPAPIGPIEIGSDVPLYERREVLIVMRNFSAIPAPYEMSVKKYAAEREHAARKGAVGNVVIKEIEKLHYTAKVDAKQFILTPQEEGEFKFASEAGKRYIGARTKRLEDKKFLTLGLGGSHLVEPKFGTLPPWGVEVIKVIYYYVYTATMVN